MKTDIEQAQLTLLNNGISIVVKTYVINADITPNYQVTLYPLFVPETTLSLSLPKIKNIPHCGTPNTKYHA